LSVSITKLSFNSFKNESNNGFGGACGFGAAYGFTTYPVATKSAGSSKSIIRFVLEGVEG
jgi:hypothetical protein